MGTSHLKVTNNEEETTKLYLPKSGGGFVEA
jgi:hypothetical protein